MTFQLLLLLNFKVRPRNFATSKISGLRQEWTLFSFFIYFYHRKIFLQCGRVSGSVFGLWRVCFLACVKSSCLVSAKKYHEACKLALPMHIWKSFSKIQGNIWCGVYFVNIVGLKTTAYLKWNSTQVLC